MSEQAFTAVEEKLRNVRDLSRWTATIYRWGGLEEFLAADRIESGIHSILLGGNILDLCFIPRAGKPALVHLHPNCPRAPDFFLPVFSGFNVTDGLDCTLIVPSDPTLHLSEGIQLCWHSGWAGQKLQEIYRKVLEKLLWACEAPYSVFWGGSGGGFAALYYSWFFRDSVAVVWNPQTDLLKYSANQVLEYLTTAFGMESIVEGNKTLPRHLTHDLRDLYGTGHQNRIAYLQNDADWHVQSHLIPLLEQMGLGASLGENLAFNGLVGDNFYLFLGNFSKGHEPPSTAHIKAALAKIVELGGDVGKFDFGGIISGE